MEGPRNSTGGTRIRAALVALLALLLALAVAGPAAATTTDAPFDSTNFQGGDGDQDAESTFIDWQSIRNDVVSQVDDGASGFSQGSKEEEPGDWVLTSNEPDNKFGILNDWAYTNEVVQPGGETHKMLYLAFVRDSPNGNTFLTFELNQRSELWDNDDDPSTPEVPCRTDGDVAVSYEVEPGGSAEPDPVTIRLYDWEEATADPDTGCSLTGEFTGGEVLNDPADANQMAQAAINEDGDITNYLDTNGDGTPDGGTFAKGTFGEAVIDLTAVFNGENRPCFSFGVINMHSRSSSEISSEVKDYIDPLDIPVRNCTASGVKFEDVDADGSPREAGEPGLAGWTIYADYNDNGVLDAGEPSDTTDEDGAYTLENLTQAYTLRELPGDDVTGDWTCSFPKDGTLPDGSGSLDDSDFPCGWGPIDPNDEPEAGRDFGNYQNATVIVKKKTVPAGAAGSFGFTTTIPGKASFSLSDGGQNSTSVTPGVYTATEAPAANFDLTDITCTGDTVEPNSSDSGSTATFNAQSGETITCVFTNTEKPGDVEVTKVADDAVVSAGDDIGFTITVTNHGPGIAHGVTLTDELPDNAGLNWTIDSSPAGCSISSGTLTCTARDLADDASYSVHITSPTTAASCAEIDNTGKVESTNGGSDEDADSVTVQCPDIDITKEADDGTVSAGDPIGFTITVINHGPGIARDVVLSDPLPAKPGLNWTIESGPAGCSITSGTLTCTARDLADDASYSVHVVSPTSAGSCAKLDNTATVTASNDNEEQASDSVTVQCPDLEITKVADDDPVSAGDPIGFTVTVTNHGPGTAHGVVLSDPLPANDGLDWEIESASGPLTCGIASGALTCTGELVSGATQTVHITSPTTAQSCAEIDNTGFVDATNADQESASDSVTVECPDLEITKVADDDLVDAGDPIGFTITVTNHGPGTAHDVTLDDPLPTTPGLSWEIEDGPAQCSITGTTLTCSAVDLGDDESYSVHITSGTTAESCAVIDNEATVSASNADDESADDSVTVQCGEVEIDKVADDTSVDSGEDVGFLITVTNTGAGTLHGVTVTDQLPGGLDWEIDGGTGAGDCTITGTTLTCDLGTLAADADPVTVHISAPTTAGENCGPLVNTAFVDTSNDGDDDATATIDIDCPAIQVIKSGPAEAYHGDQLIFTFQVKNIGDVPLSNVTVADDKCPNATRTTQDADDILVPNQTWTYTCTMPVPAHADNEANPIHNTVTATGKSPNGKTVEDTDSHDTKILHPAIDIEKTGPATATAGDVLSYTLTVTNPGDVSFASDKVVVTDPGCDDQPTLTSVNGDASPTSLDPKVDTWTYVCSHATAANVALTYPNTATVTGTDKNGRTVTDNDTIETVVNAGGTAPEEVVHGTARLRGPSGCVRSTFTATVRGSRIAQVTFFVDGKRVKRLTAPNGEGSKFTLKVNPKGRGFGVHRVTAKVVFNSASQTQTRTLRLSFQRCRKQVVQPRFTG